MIASLRLTQPLFQSTPAITGGRDFLREPMCRVCYLFQSTPAITGGRDSGCRRT